MSLCEFIRRIFGGKSPGPDGASSDRASGDAPPASPASPTARWLAADQNPFGIPILDLFDVTKSLLSTSRNPREAETALSWNSREVTDLDAAVHPLASFECELRYATDGELPDGWLYVPMEMEQKWVIGLREGRILLARSWTGAVRAFAETRRDGRDLVVHRIHMADEALQAFGDPVATFDWIIRAHALEQTLPLPVTADAAAMLERAPLAAFSLYGHIAACAAVSPPPPPSGRPIRVSSPLHTAVIRADEGRIDALLAAGQPPDVRSPVGGYTALHLAAVKGNVRLTAKLLEHGANPNVLADRDASVLITAIVHRAPVELLDLLAAHGAELTTPNVDGFGAVHAMAEIDDPKALSWLRSKGIELEGRTNAGYTPLHIAAALGHAHALEALLQAGADADAVSDSGTDARAIALAEGKSASV